MPIKTVTILDDGFTNPLCIACIRLQVQCIWKVGALHFTIIWVKQFFRLLLFYIKNIHCVSISKVGKVLNSSKVSDYLVVGTTQPSYKVGISV